MSGFWDSMYRELRCRQPVNVTPYLLLQADARRSDPAARGALLLHAIARHRQAVVRGTLDIDRERGKPMDMRQYELLYGTARIPQPVRDALAIDREARHVVVLRRHRFYVVDIAASATLEPRSEADIASDLRAIIAHSDERGVGPSIGVLSAADRDQWHRVRQQLRDHSARNANALDVIDRAVYVLALDDVQPVSDDAIGAALLHGADRLLPVRARWWDKQQIVVSFIFFLVNFLCGCVVFSNLYAFFILIVRM